ncbi:MAG: YfhO family protein, partial [Planctomycetaceae bacterium]|nr:YfhO family protein [Planctomycetaceae bacterium]
IDPKNIDSAKLKFLDEISIWRLRKPLLREYIVYEPNRIVFDVDVKADFETVVISEQYWSGWRAFDNDVEIPIKVVRKIFRAVELPKGKHRITMIYDPPLIKIGGLITLAGILIAIIFVCPTILRQLKFLSKT